MSDGKIKWVPVRFRHAISFNPMDAEFVKSGKESGRVMEASRKKFDDYAACVAECERLTDAGNCARWEFAYYAKEFAKKLNELAEDKRFFMKGVADETQDTIYATARMIEVMAREMVQ